MISLKSLMAAEEGRPVVAPSSSPSPPASTGGELGSWLSDYQQKGRGAVHSASSSVSSLFSSLTSSSALSSSISSSSSSPSSLSTSSPSSSSSGGGASNPDATSASSISSSWFAWTTPASESQSLTTPSSSTPTSTASWLSSIPGYGGGEDSSVCFGLSWHQRLGLFFLSCFAGALMLFLSFSFLPLILLGQSSKFTMAYALANVFFLASSSFLTGPQQQLMTMFHPSRMAISSLYLLSLVGTLYAAWQVRVFYVVLPLMVVQVVTLLMYVMSYLPFGPAMMKRMALLFLASMRKMFFS